MFNLKYVTIASVFMIKNLFHYITIKKIITVTFKYTVFIYKKYIWFILNNMNNPIYSTFGGDLEGNNTKYLLVP